MGKLSVFNFISLNGYYKGANGDLSWHRHGTEENEYAVNSMKGGSRLLFGRITYELMASYWPTATATEENPIVAAGMNHAEKIVFSNTLKEAAWQHTKIMSGDIVSAIRNLKENDETDMTILGSGSIVSLFASEGLIDRYMIMIDPVALHVGTPIFSNIKHNLQLSLVAARTFNSGVVLLTYQPLNDADE
jgi:dihydrofolate reductase